MSLSLRATYLLIAVIVLSNFILWLDSFDRYLGSRYHVTLSEILPEAVFAPSRQLLALTGQSSEPPVAPPVVEESEAEPPKVEVPKLVAQTDPKPEHPPAIAAVTPTPVPAPSNEAPNAGFDPAGVVISNCPFGPRWYVFVGAITREPICVH